MIRDAEVSPCGTWRYSLTRGQLLGGLFGMRRTVTFVMLNPSTADVRHDDPAIHRCIDFARREQAGTLHVVNLFGLRSARPGGLFDHTDPVGPGNDAALLRMVRAAQLVILAWGGHPAARSAVLGRRASTVLGLLGQERPLWCLGRTADGAPRHPLYVPARKRLEAWGDIP